MSLNHFLDLILDVWFCKRIAYFGFIYNKGKGFTSCLVNPLNLMGWLMGLEPTTTGITILKNDYLLS